MQSYIALLIRKQEFTKPKEINQGYCWEVDKVQKKQTTKVFLFVNFLMLTHNCGNVYWILYVININENTIQSCVLAVYVSIPMLLIGFILR